MNLKRKLLFFVVLGPLFTVTLARAQTPINLESLNIIYPANVTVGFQAQVLAVVRDYFPNLTVIGPQAIAKVSDDEKNAIEAVLIEENLIQMATPPVPSKLLTPIFRWKVIATLQSFGLVNPSPIIAGFFGFTGVTGSTGATGQTGPQGPHGLDWSLVAKGLSYFSFQLNFSASGNTFAQSATNVPQGWTVSGFNTGQITVTHNIGVPVAKVIFSGCDTSVSPALYSITYPSSAAPTQISTATLNSQLTISVSAPQVKADSSTGNGFVTVYCGFQQ
jgi:hypothetical protein